jgi:hypothetical protein
MGEIRSTNFWPPRCPRRASTATVPRFTLESRHRKDHNARRRCARKLKLLSLGDSGKLVGSRGGVVEHLYNYYFLVIFLIGTVIVFLVSAFGWRVGTRTEGHGASGNISALEQYRAWPW